MGRGTGEAAVGERFETASGLLGAIDLRVIGGIVLSWLVTLPAGGILAALFFFLFKGMFG